MLVVAALCACNVLCVVCITIECGYMCVRVHAAGPWKFIKFCGVWHTPKNGTQPSPSKSWLSECKLSPLNCAPASSRDQIIGFPLLHYRKKKDPIENFGSCLLPQCTDISTEVFSFCLKLIFSYNVHCKWQDSALSILSRITCGSRQTTYRSLQHLAKHQLCSEVKTLLAWLDAQNGVKNDIKMWFPIFLKSIFDHHNNG